MATKSAKRKIKKNVPSGVAHVNATFNNTIITITDEKGEQISGAKSRVLLPDEAYRTYWFPYSIRLEGQPQTTITRKITSEKASYCYLKKPPWNNNIIDIREPNSGRLQTSMYRILVVRQSTISLNIFQAKRNFFLISHTNFNHRSGKTIISSHIGPRASFISRTKFNLKGDYSPYFRCLIIEGSELEVLICKRSGYYLQRSSN